jgi:quinoprotein glucose dehydrogenase
MVATGTRIATAASTTTGDGVDRQRGLEWRCRPNPSMSTSPTPAAVPKPALLTLRLMSVLLALLALVFVVGGGWLLALGGSAYYLLAGLGLVAVAAWLPRRTGAALATYAGFFAATLAWALWEAGLDWWPLATRLGLPWVLGVVLLLCAWRRPAAVGAGSPVAAPARTGPLALALVLAGFVLCALASWWRDEDALTGQLAIGPPVAGASGSTGAAAAAASGGPVVPPGEWHAYGRTGAGQRYSPLAQITPRNIGQLQPAWTFRTGDARGRPGDPEETTFEATPLKIGNRLFFCTPHQSVIALDATTGAQVWRRDLQIRPALALQHLTCRGLSYHATDATAPAPADCRERLFMPTADGRLVALDLQDGRSCPSFGGGKGEIDLWAGMPNVKPGAYYSTSPVAVTRRLVIVGGTVLDNASVNEQSGVIRAYDAITGALVWAWDSARPDHTEPLPPGQTYTPNSPNSWSVSSVDEALGLVYVPIGNQPPDQWGGARTPAVERFSSSVVALDIATGRVRWVFQTVHHDLWDYDVPAQPVLVDLVVRGQPVPALVQPTKQGDLFVLDRRSGTPLHPVTEQPAPQGAAAGDRTAPTQPASALSLAPETLTERDMWGATLVDQMVCRILFRRLRYEGRFTPPSVQGSLVHPGNFGVFNWGSIAVDPVRRIAFTTPAALAFTSQLVPRPDDKTLLVQSKGPPQGSLPALNENFGAPFASRMAPFTSPFGLPCHEPPWGRVAGVDLDTGRVVWRHRNGTVRDLAPLPLPFPMGVPSLGGPIVTAGGVAFLSGTLDYYVRGYDLADGRVLWRQRLPAGGQATPMSYLDARGRQVLLVVAGGHGSTGTRTGDYVLAYRLPD